MHDNTTGRPATLASGVEPGPLTRVEQAELFQRPLLARVATVDADGAPYVVPLWFLWEYGAFWLVIRETARFVPHVLREPRICLSIAAETPPYARATVMGRAEIVGRPRESEAWKPIACRMAVRYIGQMDASYLDRTADLPRWLVRVVPYRMTTWRGGGWSRYYFT